jgi:Tfp pilus assembly protein PilV
MNKYNFNMFLIQIVFFFQNDYECRCLPGYSGKACQILPDGTVLKLHQDEELDQNRVGLIVTFSVLIPALAVLAALVLLFNKHKRKLDLSQANAKAKWENELNMMQIVSKSRIVDGDHHDVIVNTLNYPKQKCVNASATVCSNDAFSDDVSSYERGVRSKQTNKSEKFFEKEMCSSSISNSSELCSLNSCKQTFDSVPSSSSSTSGASDIDFSSKDNLLRQSNQVNKIGKCAQNKMFEIESVSCKKNFDSSSECSFSVNSRTQGPDEANQFRSKIEELCNKKLMNL